MPRQSRLLTMRQQASKPKPEPTRPETWHEMRWSVYMTNHSQSSNTSSPDSIYRPAILAGSLLHAHAQSDEMKHWHLPPEEAILAVDLTDNEWCWRLDNRWRQTCSPLFTRPCVDTNAVKVLRLTDLLWQTCPWVACWLSLPRATRILWAEAGRKDLRCQPDSVYRLYLTGVLSNLQ